MWQIWRTKTTTRFRRHHWDNCAVNWSRMCSMLVMFFTQTGKSVSGVCAVLKDPCCGMFSPKWWAASQLLLYFFVTLYLESVHRKLQVKTKKSDLLVEFGVLGKKATGFRKWKLPLSSLLDPSLPFPDPPPVQPRQKPSTNHISFSIFSFVFVPWECRTRF